MILPKLFECFLGAHKWKKRPLSVWGHYDDAMGWKEQCRKCKIIRVTEYAKGVNTPVITYEKPTA